MQRRFEPLRLHRGEPLQIVDTVGACRLGDALDTCDLAFFDGDDQLADFGMRNPVLAAIAVKVRAPGNTAAGLTKSQTRWWEHVRGQAHAARPTPASEPSLVRQPRHRPPHIQSRPTHPQVALDNRARNTRLPTGPCGRRTCQDTFTRDLRPPCVSYLTFVATYRQSNRTSFILRLRLLRGGGSRSSRNRGRERHQRRRVTIHADSVGSRVRYSTHCRATRVRAKFAAPLGNGVRP